MTLPLSDSVAAFNARLHPGVTPAMATPLQRDGVTVKDESILPLVDFLIAKGVAGLFAGGTTGEGILLTVAERTRLHELTATAVAGRVPLLVHVGASDTLTAVALAEHAASLPDVGLVAITPPMYALADESLLDYFQAIAAVAPDRPFYVYDIPHVAVNGVSPDLWLELAETVPNLAGIKSSNRDAHAVRALLAVTGERILLAGNERVALGLLAMGAHGLISGLATAVPEPFVALTTAVARGDIPAARRHHTIINTLLDLIPPGARIGALKALLNARGLDIGPAVPPREAPIADLWGVMAEVIGK